MADKYWIGTDGSYSTAGNWSPTNAPVAADVVFIAGTGTVISSGLDQSGVSIDGFIVENFSYAIGKRNEFLQVALGSGDRFEFDGTGQSYIDVGSSAVSPIIKRTARNTNVGGLFLKGSALATVDVLGPNATVNLIDATVTTVNIHSGCTVFVDEDSTVTTLNNMGGTVIIEGYVATLNNRAGATTYNGSGSSAVTKIDVTGGSVVSNTTRTTTAADITGGTLDYAQSNASRTVTTLNYYGGTVAGFEHVAVTTLNTNGRVNLATPS